MARRSDHSRKELREMALEIAHRIVAAEGLRGLTARRVAREIGYTIGTIYNLFSNFDDLIDHMNGETMDRLKEAFEEANAEDEPHARLHRLADSYIRFVAAHPKEYVALFERQRVTDGHPPHWYNEKVVGLMKVVETAIKPLLPDATPAALEAQARVLWAGSHGIISLEGPERIGNSERAGELVGLLVDNFLASRS